MHIIHVTHGYSNKTGGVQKVAKELSENLVRLGHTITVYTPGYDADNDQIDPHQNLKIKRLLGIEFAHTPLTPSLIYHLLKAPKDSIIHVHIAKALLPEIVWFVAKIRKIPYIAHFHLDVDSSGVFGFLLPLYKKLFLSNVLRDANKVIVLSDEHKCHLQSQYKLINDIEVVPNGVNDEFFLEEKNINKDHTNLLFVGRLSVQKNVLVLIDAMKYVKSPVTLHIVGDGDKKEEIVEHIQKLPKQNVILHGRLEGSDLIKAFSDADIFVLPSHKEGLPLVLIEAMAANLPVIASDVPGNREFVSDAGVLVDPVTPEQFAYEIDRLIDSPGLQKSYKKIGRQKAESLRWKAITQEFEKIYEEVLNDS